MAIKLCIRILAVVNLAAVPDATSISVALPVGMFFVSRDSVVDISCLGHNK
jgi:hypothetical protein